MVRDDQETREWDVGSLEMGGDTSLHYHLGRCPNSFYSISSRE